MWRIGASLDVEDVGGDFNDWMSILGEADDFVCKAEEDLSDFDLSAGDAGIVYEVEDTRL
jgi:hypothetical protein